MKETVEINGATAARRHRAGARDRHRELLPPTPRNRGADDRLGMAHEPVRHRRRKAAADHQLQLVPLLPADFPQPLRRSRLGQDRLSHDPWRRLAADQCQCSAAAFSDEDEARLVQWLATRARARIPRTRTSSRCRGRRGARPGSSSPNTNCRAWSPPRMTCRAIPRATSGTARIAAPMSAGSIRKPARSRNSTCRRSPRRAAGHALDPCRQERHRLGLGKLGARHLAARSRTPSEFKRDPVEGQGTGEFADGRQLCARSAKASSGRRATSRSARSTPITGDLVTSYILKKFAGTYGSAMSNDGRYFGGGAWPRDGVVVADTQDRRSVRARHQPQFRAGARRIRSADNNYWSAGRGGVLVKFDTNEKRIHEYPLPTPYASMYTAMADKNGEVWGGEMHSGRYFRFNPKNGAVHRIRAAGALRPRPRKLDRQFDRSGDRLVRGPRGLDRAHPADGVATQRDAAALRCDQRTIDLEQL